MNMTHKLFTLCLMGTLLFAQSPSSFDPDPYNPDYDPHTLLIKFRDEAQLDNAFAKTGTQSGVAAIDRIMNKYGVISIDNVFKNAKPVLGKKTFLDPNGQIHEIPSLDKIYRITYREDIDPKDLAKELENEPSLDYAEPDYYVYMMLSPDDPFYQSTDQWYIDAVNAPAAWDSTTADTNQIISIIDTGVDWDHPDLDGNIWINRAEYNGIEGIDDDGNGYIDDIRGWDFINDDNDPNDDNSHGTHVAGIAAAETNNGIGIAGIAPNARIMPIKVLQSTGSGNSSDLAAGIDYAAQNGATVINMSLGSYGESITVKTALENAYATAVLVAAAGNDDLSLLQEGFPEGNMYPACYNFVLGVEASTQTGEISSFSNYDPSGPVRYLNEWGYNYEIKAPGTDIFSTFPNGTYRDLNGTSMASPIVAGAVALMKTHDPSQTTEQIFARIIQSANGGILDISNALDYTLVPDLNYMNFTVVDTLPGCDKDGIADAGETIELVLTIKNAGGYAEDVWVILGLGEFEDPDAVVITDSLSDVGNLSAYAELNTASDPFVIEIPNETANQRDIVFTYKIGFGETQQAAGEFSITVQNAEEINGIIDGTVTLSNDKKYLVSNSLVVTGLLMIEPGTELLIADDKSIVVTGEIIANGKSDSMIVIKNQGTGGWANIRFEGEGDGTFSFCEISGTRQSPGQAINNSGNGLVNFTDCVFSEHRCFDGLISGMGITIFRSNIINNNNTYTNINLSRNTVKYCNIINNTTYAPSGFYASGVSFSNENNVSKGNHVFNNSCKYYGPANAVIQTNPFGVYKLPRYYWGTTDSLTIGQRIIDFYEQGDLSVADYSDFLKEPNDTSHGFVWKVDINDVSINKLDNPYNSTGGLGIIGSEILKFDVHFNRAMDTTVTPFVSFGVREPYTQHIVDGSTSWNSDSTIWTAYYTVDLETGDGIQRVRVALAEDNKNFDIPIEDERFEFVIQVASAAGVKFFASAGIGKVDLEWSKSHKRDELGYNVYRYAALTDSTWTDTLRINDELVTDTLFTDYDVLPDSTYHYLFTVIGTDMSETDFSKAATATVLSAANGDANGDLSVNVLDIITIVAHILDRDPNPFLFDAADINHDGSINVLDIIGVVSIILNPGMGKQAYADATESMFYLEDEKIYASSNGAVGGYQFTIKGTIDDLALHSDYPMELVTGKLDDETLLVLAYSLNGTTIPEGNHAILTMSHTDDIAFDGLLVGDTHGRFVTSSFGTSTDLIVPAEFALDQNYPNPFNASTTIRYQLPEASDVNLSIYNVLGHKVFEQQINGQRAGYYTYAWHGLDNHGHILSSGVYIYRINAGEFADSRKMILMK